MSRIESSIVKVSGRAASFLTRYAQEDQSLDSLQQYRVLPRVKLIQGTSPQALKDLCGEGSAILAPENSLIAAKNEIFRFVTLYATTEYIHWKDLNDVSGSPILGMSRDPNSEIAKRCKNPELRFEVYDGKFKSRYSEHINFAGLIYGEHPLSGSDAVLSFFRGEFNQGKLLSTGMVSRKETLPDGNRVRIPLWAQVWKFTPKFRDKGPSKKWFGLDFEADGIINDDEFELFEEKHRDLRALYGADKVKVDYSDALDEQTIAENSPM